MKRFLVGLTLFLVILVFLGGSNTNGMTILTDEKMMSIFGEWAKGTEGICAAQITCFPWKSEEQCVKLPTSLPALVSNPNDNMESSGAQCGNIWTNRCRVATTRGCGGPIVDSVDP